MKIETCNTKLELLSMWIRKANYIVILRSHTYYEKNIDQIVSKSVILRKEKEWFTIYHRHIHDNPWNMLEEPVMAFHESQSLLFVQHKSVCLRYSDTDEITVQFHLSPLETKRNPELTYLYFPNNTDSMYFQEVDVIYDIISDITKDKIVEV